MLSRLQAINQMLVAVGEQVILVEVAGAGDFANASAILDAETTKVLAKGWDFNTDNKVTLTPDASGVIAVPADVLFVDPIDPQVNYVQRGLTLWDADKQVSTFTAPVDVTMIRNFPFEACPFNVQREIVGRASMAYQRAYVGSAQLDQFAKEERAEAVADARDAESDSDDFNILNNADLYWLRRQVIRRGI
ncbi:hypothetical protein QTI51_09570 [Variovorax sp. J22G73]|uniref:hypothetical protein n=1 Tax=unclassified Variovorax TaxID=663243 RepID=UPI00257524D2|nr:MULTISPECIES: hypothetical protein [unclassified Variovorax]MDM0006452.1 hypothetical protein [Variovorax sp. J22R203]MDM0097525.1 hypothetical protein [Variovorax sp. J22G73]